jgi:hypothetical protein
MDFIVEGEIQKTVTVNTEAHISITKKEVMRVTGCPAAEDGDSTAWYGYVEEALLCGADYTLKDSNDDIVNTKSNFTEVTDVAWT